MVGLSKRKRFNVFKRDGFKCQYCGRTPPGVVLEIDHVIPKSKDGTDDESNLVTSCFDCNRGKADGSLQSVPSSVSERSSRQRELAEQVKMYHKYVATVRAQEDETIDALGRYWYNQLTNDKDKYTWGGERRRSARMFLNRMSLEQIYESIDIAFGRKPSYSIDRDETTWKYFCGVCWKTIKSGEA